MNTNLRHYLTALFAIPAFILCVITASRAQDQTPKKIAPEETPSYTNHIHKVIVTGKVAEVFETDKSVHLNFGKPRPDHNFTVLIAAYKAPSFPELKQMKGKTIEATGFISASQGKPLMYMGEPKDLKVVAEKK